MTLDYRTASSRCSTLCGRPTAVSRGGTTTASLTTKGTFDLDVVNVDVAMWDVMQAVNVRGTRILMCKHAVPLNDRVPRRLDHQHLHDQGLCGVTMTVTYGTSKEDVNALRCFVWRRRPSRDEYKLQYRSAAGPRRSPRRSHSRLKISDDRSTKSSSKPAWCSASASRRTSPKN